MKLWQGRFEEEQDPVFEKMNRSLPVDAVLLEVDVRASRAHARGLLGAGILNEEEWKTIDRGLEGILSQYSPDEVKAMPYEDIHTFVEATLAEKVGAVALKLHTGRSRNDQVATDFRLFTVIFPLYRASVIDPVTNSCVFVKNASRDSRNGVNHCPS